MWNIISSNKLIDKQLKQKERQRHINRMKSIKATMKISEPIKPDFLFSKAKHSVLKTEIEEEIDHKNHILLEHMRLIQKKSQNYWRKKQRATTPNLQCRKRLSQMLIESKKIDDENQIIGRRLTTIHSEYQGISSLHLDNSRRLFSASRSRPLSGTTTFKIAGTQNARPVSGISSLKLRATQNTAPDYNQFRNTENLEQMVNQYDSKDQSKNKDRKTRHKSGYQRRVFTQNVQYL